MKIMYAYIFSYSRHRSRVDDIDGFGQYFVAYSVGLLHLHNLPWVLKSASAAVNEDIFVSTYTSRHFVCCYSSHWLERVDYTN